MSSSCTCDVVKQALPNLCDPLPLSRVSLTLPSPEEKEVLAKFHAVKAYRDRVWGPALWTALEGMILTLPPKLDENDFCTFKTYLALTARYMPCENCGRHFSQHLADMPNTIAIRTRAGLLKWITDVKNDVNRQRGKPILSTDEIIEVLNKNNEDPAEKKKTEQAENTPASTTTSPQTPMPPTTSSSTNSSPHSLTSIIILAIAVVLLGALIWRGLKVHKSRKNRKGSRKSQ